jgi:hypothetical protein
MMRKTDVTDTTFSMYQMGFTTKSTHLEAYIFQGSRSLVKMQKEGTDGNTAIV